jgi:UDP-N-acetylmuramate--alanine ligase
MSSIAEVLLRRGFRVTGSDQRKSAVTEHLETLGATIYEGHAEAHVDRDVQAVVYSSAVDPEDNPETQAAQLRRIPLIKRAEMLGELMRMQYGVGVAGTHGKTTTTTLAGLVVQHGGFDPTIIVGGKVAVFGSNAVAGEGDVMVLEADEYDRTFLRLTPSLAVITNIDADHLDIYDDLAEIDEAFITYARRVPFFGAAIVCLDDPGVRRIVRQIDRRVVTYGTTRQAEIRAHDVQPDGLVTRFEVWRGAERLGEATLQTPGLHNVRNALAAIAVGLELEIPFDTIAEGLARFTGVERRFQHVGTERGITVIDDYAHHPTEILATLAAASASFPDRRIVAVFQPHLYSRTRDFKDAFASAFFDADVLVVTGIYPAREKPIPGITGQLVADLARQSGHQDVRYVDDAASVANDVLAFAQEGDVILTLGAGDITKRARELTTRLAETGLP